MGHMKQAFKYNSPALESDDLGVLEDGTLLHQAEAAMPEFKSDQAALLAFTQELQALSEKHQMSVDAFISESHNSVKTNDDFDRARTLVRYLGFLKRT